MVINLRDGAKKIKRTNKQQNKNIKATSSSEAASLESLQRYMPIS